MGPHLERSDLIGVHLGLDHGGDQVHQFPHRFPTADLTTNQDPGVFAKDQLHPKSGGPRQETGVFIRRLGLTDDISDAGFLGIPLPNPG